MLDAEAVTHSAKVASKPAQSTGRLAGWLHGAWETRKSPAREGAPALRHRQTHECNSTVAFLRALATLNQQKPTGSPELGRSPFWDRPSRALPDPEEMPASDPSRPPVGPTVNDVPASFLLVPYIISRQAGGERKASAGSQAGRSGEGGFIWLHLQTQRTPEGAAA